MFIDGKRGKVVVGVFQILVMVIGIFAFAYLFGRVVPSVGL